MKQIFVCFISLLFVICITGCSAATPNDSNKVPPKVSDSTAKSYVKAIWIAYYELQQFTKDNNEKAFSEKIASAFSELKEMGFNTLTVQVRPCADAFYYSKLFPCSAYCFDVQGADMPYDPLKIMCDCAHRLDLRLEAWINPYRVSQNGDIASLCEENIAKKWLSKKKYKSRVYVTKKGIYFNPACKEVTKLIADGVREIVSQYSVDGIHFDDYFYPTDNEKIDQKEFKEYQDSGGKLSLSDWRRENVSTMIKTVYQTVKRLNPDVAFGVSPAANMENDKNKLFADVERWASEEGFVDYICPQVYFGFRNVYQPFMFTVKKWVYITNRKLYVGLPLYKAGKPDKYAADENKSIINEFKNSNNILARQAVYLSKLEEVSGFYVFSYSSLNDEKAKEETENLLKAMQDIRR